MIRATLIVALLMGLAACGVDGRPTPPEPRPTTTPIAADCLWFRLFSPVPVATRKRALN